jgi:hypothetical protein
MTLIRFLFSVPASANTTSVHAGNNCKPGITSMASAGRSGHRKPITKSKTTAVTASITQYTGGVNVKAIPSTSDINANNNAHRHLGSFQAIKKFSKYFFNNS